ncbi:translation factor GUF1 homolog, mitochondrial-like [Oppia nitens]|uniref:translation factor GUF1 homolog, mitochondrial-like n=1 Tax=Oppia nitens TaxID=1686743 RepID=UPI0023DBF994|nr:translation factor GUF1 homolog, mitochondrial-like [Oppia nitens]
MLFKLCPKYLRISFNIRTVIHQSLNHFSDQKNDPKMDPISKITAKEKTIDLKCYTPDVVRNFCIIAHIDHGKTTLSDRLLEVTKTIPKELNAKQYLDKLDVERERGITVKAQTCSMVWHYNNTSYLLNLIDTPGHVDFSYEVWRSVAACEGAVILVDANSGVQAQTISHFNYALLSELTLIPVLNKVDLKNADPDSVTQQMNKLFDINSSDILKVSAKLGTGVEQLLNEVISRIPAPKANTNGPLRALIFDLWHQKFRGIILLIRVIDGCLRVGDNITISSNQKVYAIRKIGILHPNEVSTDCLYSGQVGVIEANIQDHTDVNVGDIIQQSSADNITNNNSVCVTQIQKAIPMVFASVYPCERSAYNDMARAIDKLILNDNGVDIQKESHPALGNGFRLGFLGLLHMEVFCQRLDDEFDAQVVITAPSVPYKVKIRGEKNIKIFGAEELVITNASKLPDVNIISEYYEPMTTGTIITPDQYLNVVNNLCLDRRGVQLNSYYIDNSRLLIQYRFPLSEIIVDFYDVLKSVTSGYASFDYEDSGYESTKLVKLDILLNDKRVDELSTLVNTIKARSVGRSMCTKLKDHLQKQQFKIKIQAVIGNKIIAREDVKAFRKDVTQHLYGGDDTRRQKLLKRQAEGKARLKRVGNIEISTDTFINVFKR